MKEWKICTFEEVLDEIPLSREAWTRLSDLPEAEYAAAVRKELKWPEGFLEKLRGKPLEEQMTYYRVVETVCRSKTARGALIRRPNRE